MKNQTTPWLCQYCGESTADLEADYVVGYDHLSCKLKDIMQDNSVEVCVVCGTQTVYKKSTPLEYRYRYVEGVGQACKVCYENTK